jgi:S-adenosylmethionine hydrolase
MRPIALLTDFGTRDPYVAAMKGVIASRCSAPIIDLSHEIAAFDVWESAFFLRDVVPYWPAGTIFVCVVDPGVGTSRRIIAVESEGRIFLAPDNGLLHFVGGEAYEVNREELFLAPHPASGHLLPASGAKEVDFEVLASSERAEGALDPDAPPPAISVDPRATSPSTSLAPQGGERVAEGRVRGDRTIGGSTTFHGRDRFAPVAAALANGFPIAELGPKIDDRIALEYTPGCIVRIDRFGNCVTDIARPDTPFSVIVRDQRLDDLRTTYSGDGAFVIIGSTGCIEISVAGGSAASLLHLSRGDRVTIAPQ